MPSYSKAFGLKLLVTANDLIMLCLSTTSYLDHAEKKLKVDIVVFFEDIEILSHMLRYHMTYEFNFLVFFPDHVRQLFQTCVHKLLY